MTRLEAVAGLAVLSLVAGGLGHKYVALKTLAETPAPEREIKISRESRPVPTVDGVVHAYLTEVTDVPESERWDKLGALLSALETPELAMAPVDGEVGELLAKAVIAGIGSSPDESPEGLELRRRAVAVVAGRTSSPESREFVMKTLSKGPQTLRDEALRQIGKAGGVRGPEFFAKVQELQAAGQVPEAILPGALRRSGGTKAKQPLLDLLASTSSKRLIAGCAVALQDLRDPALLGPVLERMEQLGMLEEGVKMPWISMPLFDKHLETAEGSALRRGMLAVRARPALAKSGLAKLEKGLSSPDAETRRVAYQAVKKAVVAKTVGVEQGTSLLAGRVESETEPVLKAELTGSLESLRGQTVPETGVQ
jgi:hypothetical protein